MFVSTSAKKCGRSLDADLWLRRTGAFEGMESRMHLNMRPQMRHILSVVLRDGRRVSSRLVQYRGDAEVLNCVAIEA